MYEEHFGFRRSPFAATPDARCFFAPPKLQETVDELVLRLDAGQGVCVLTAAAGMGKSLVCRVVAAELDARFHVVSLAAPGSLTRKALLQTLLADRAPPHPALDEQQLRLQVVAALRNSVRQDRPCVLLVDEVHLLSPKTLEELRALTIQDELGHPLLRLMLAGQPRFEEILTAPEYDALNQQIVCHKLLESFTLTESVEYVLHRVALAGGDPERQFSIPALDLIVHAAAGNPRLLNRLCDLSLILACAQGLPQVDLSEVERALAELRQLPLRWNEDHPRSREPSTGTELRGGSSSAENDSHSPDDSTQFPSSDRFEAGQAASWDRSEQRTAGSREDERAAGSLDDWNDASAPSDIAAEAKDPGVFPLEPTVFASAVDTFETVSDPYAALDPQRPRLLRTYDDQALAADWNARGRAANLPPQSPPDPPSNLEFDTLPTRVPTVDHSGLDGSKKREIGDASRDQGPAPLLTRRVGKGPLRSGVSGWSEEDFDVVEPESTPAPAVERSLSAADHAESTTQEVPETNPAQAIADRQGSRIATVHADHSSPPTMASRSPGMGMLFSTLRRKLGRSPGR